MAIVKTKYPVLHDSRHRYSSIIEVEIVDFKEIPTGIVVTVEDYCYKNREVTDDDGNVISVKDRVSKKETIKSITFSSAKVDVLASAIQAMLPENPTESERREILKRVALLHYVQTDPLNDFPDKRIYYTDPEDWEIKAD